MATLSPAAHTHVYAEFPPARDTEIDTDISRLRFRISMHARFVSLPIRLPVSYRAAVSLISPFLSRLGSPSARSTRGTSRRASLVAPNTVITAWLANLHLVAHVLLVSFDARATRRSAARRVFSAVLRSDSILNASLLCRGDKHNTTPAHASWQLAQPTQARPVHITAQVCPISWTFSLLSPFHAALQANRESLNREFILRAD